MELLPLVLVLLAGTLATSIHLHRWNRNSGVKEIALDMAPNSFDDQYLRCHFKMARALPTLNLTEFVPYSDYAEAWNRAVAVWGSRNPRAGESLLQMEQAIAILAYTMEEGLYLEFNRAVRVAGRSRRAYLDTFHFKVMHFLLTEALSELRGARAHPQCLHVYRGIDGIRFSSRPGHIIRFGQFASASLLKNVSESYGTSTTFEVDTCHGAAIRHFSYYPDEEEVIIPPFETFNVTEITHQGDDIYIHLRSHGVHSKYNCAWFRGDVPGVGTAAAGSSSAGTGERVVGQMRAVARLWVCGMARLQLCSWDGMAWDGMRWHGNVPVVGLIPGGSTSSHPELRDFYGFFYFAQSKELPLTPFSGLCR